MERDLINTSEVPGEKLTSTYAEIYLQQEHFCESNVKGEEVIIADESSQIDHDLVETNSNWESPSDALITLVDLKPPFTSKFIRGKTHQGILSIGDSVLQAEREKWLNKLNKLIEENNAVCEYILQHEKEKIIKRLTETYKNIFNEKRLIMTEQLDYFYEKSLDDLEEHIKSELRHVLLSAHSNMISDMDIQINAKLLEEKKILNKILWDQYFSEMRKIIEYYKLLLDNEYYRRNKFIKRLVIERNNALNAFAKHYEAETLTSTMYILASERKKCRIKTFLLNTYDSTVTQENMDTIKRQQEILKELKDKDVPLSKLNKQWEEKLEKILQLFLKFMSFCMQLLPEQTSFLLDLKTLMVLQLSELQKFPNETSNILVKEEDFENVFHFEKPSHLDPVCEARPFIIEGDSSDSINAQYGSRETLPSDVDLPLFRVQRKFIYAKCEHFNAVKAYLEKQRCKCRDPPVIGTQSIETLIDEEEKPSEVEEEEEHELLEPIIINDFSRLDGCPAISCRDWQNDLSFPHLNAYLDFTDKKYERVKAMLGNKHSDVVMPELLDVKDIAYQELPFSETVDKTYNKATQYSSQEGISPPACTCTNNDVDNRSVHSSETPVELPEMFQPDHTDKIVNDALKKRRLSLLRLIKENSKIAKIFTDIEEDYDYVM